jgi:enoyl-CoA hydratase/carnithine racemase
MLVSTSIAPGLLELDFNRAEKHNAINTSLYEELETGLRAAQSNTELRAVVLTASGKSFCAGNDLAEFDTSWPQPDDGPVFRFLSALHYLDVPLIAAVQGAAIGIGATMLLQCDVIYAAPASYLRFPFVDLGIALEGGSSHFLFTWLGRPRAMEILLSGRQVPAAEAEQLGLISRVVDDPQSSARQFAHRLTGKSAAAMRATKRLARRSLESVFPKRFAEELAAVNELLEGRANVQEAASRGNE